MMLCSLSIAPPLTNVLDISQVAGTFGGSFMDVVQYNKDNTEFEVKEREREREREKERKCGPIFHDISLALW